MKISFIPYNHFCPDIEKSILKKFGKYVCCIKIDDKFFPIFESLPQIIEESKNMKAPINYKYDQENWLNMFNFYSEHGYCSPLNYYNIYVFLNRCLKQYKKSQYNSFLNILADKNIIKIFKQVKLGDFFLRRNNINPQNYYFPYVFEFLANNYEQIENSLGYKWFTNIYLPVIFHLENNAPFINFSNIRYRDKRKDLNNIFIGTSMDSQVYPDYNVGITGRIYCRNPNLQSISKDDEEILYQPKTKFHLFDFKNFEVQIIAYLSGDRKLNYLIENGIDIYYYLLSIKENRKYNEIVNLPNIENLRKQIKKEFLASIYNAKLDIPVFNELNKWKKSIIKNSINKKTHISFYVFREITSECHAINYPVQCFAANISVYTCKKLIDNGYTVRVYKHDSFLVDSEHFDFQIDLQKIIKEVEPF